MKVLVCPLSEPGYLYPAIAVGRELRHRDHAVTVLARPAAAPVVAEAGLEFASAAEHGEPYAFNADRWALEGAGQYRAALRAARAAGADVLVASILCQGALLAAEVMDIPVVVIGFAAHLWEYESGGQDESCPKSPREWRSRVALQCYQDAREQLGMPARPAGSGDFPLNGTVTLLRGDPCLEYPGAELPDRVRHVGPCAWEPRPDPAKLGAVLARLDRVGKPVVYVHLARLFRSASPWPRLIAAFTGGPFQAVAELGRSDEPAPGSGADTGAAGIGAADVRAADVRGADVRGAEIRGAEIRGAEIRGAETRGAELRDADILLVREPWMGPLLDRAGLVLTGGTSAPVLGALAHGLPLGVSPGGSEQPLLAAACVRAGVAVAVANEQTAGAAAVLESAWNDQGMRARAGELARRLASAGGAGLAADITVAVAGSGYWDVAAAPTGSGSG